MRRYIRFYAGGDKVRSMGGSKETIYAMIAKTFPHIYKLVDFVAPPREPIMIMGFYVSKKSKKHRLRWIIRGYEEAERYRPTTIYIPNTEIVFDPDEDRSQGSCFMKLLEGGYSLASYEEFLKRFDSFNPDADAVDRIVDSTIAMI